MSDERVDLGAGLLVVGSVLLVISLFLNWYEPGLSAWTVFELIDLVLAALAVTAAATVLSLFAGAGVRAWMPTVTRQGMFFIALAAFVIVLLQLINHPPAAVDRSPLFGAWLALGATLLMLLGAIMGAAAISVAVRLGARDELLATRRPEEPTERRS